jgi:glucosylglycerate synthase
MTGSATAPAETVLARREIREAVEEIGSADIVVGIPSFNNVATIRGVVRAVLEGLSRYFPGRRGVIVNADGGSTDGTREIVAAEVPGKEAILLAHRTRDLHAIAALYAGIPGKGSAFRAVFEIASALDARACAVCDADLRSITPEWIELLVRPALEEGFDFVAPLYRRHRYDGTITNAIVYPFTRALYGKRIRQPIGGDFGFSGAMAGRFLQGEGWDGDVARFGIDVWMTTTAVASGGRICQSFLGTKLHAPKNPATELVEMLCQVVGAAFCLASTYEAVWRPVSASEPVPLFGKPLPVPVEPVPVDLHAMLERFRRGASQETAVWEEVLRPETFHSFIAAAAAPAERFRIPDDTWAETVYSFAAAWHRNRLPRARIAAALVPLYLGRTASFAIETAGAGDEEVEERIERLCLVFEGKKDFLRKEWG